MVIKPDALYNLCKRCPDSKWVGDIVRRLCGQEVSLDFGQEQAYAVVRDDCVAFERRMDEIRARDAKRKAAYRARKEAELMGQGGTDADAAKVAKETDVPHCPTGQGGTDADGRGHSGELSTETPENVDKCGTRVCPTPTIHPTTPPSLPPSTLPPLPPPVSVCVNNAPARTRPGLEEVVAAATSVMGVTEEFARWWYAEMEARDWRTTSGRIVGLDNWRATLKAWSNRASKEELAEVGRTETARARRTKRWTAGDWAFCAEACAEFREGRCAAGCITPPDHRPRPIPPRECAHYRAREGAE